MKTKEPNTEPTSSTSYIQTNELLIEAISKFLLEANVDLIKAEQDEHYEQCDFIQTALHLGINYYTDETIKMNPTFNRKPIFDSIQEQSNWIFNQLRIESTL